MTDTITTVVAPTGYRVVRVRTLLIWAAILGFVAFVGYLAHIQNQRVLDAIAARPTQEAATTTSAPTPTEIVLGMGCKPIAAPVAPDWSPMYCIPKGMPYHFDPKAPVWIEINGKPKILLGPKVAKTPLGEVVTFRVQSPEGATTQSILEVTLK